MDVDLFLQMCDVALNRKEKAASPDYLATYLEIFSCFLLIHFYVEMHQHIEKGGIQRNT